MSFTMEYAMGTDMNRIDEAKKCLCPTACAILHELDRQRLRILRCTAQAMACSPGALRFKAGTRPWLEGLVSGREMTSPSWVPAPAAN